MKCNQSGIDLIKRFEGKKNTVYLDIVGVPTVGYGSTHHLTKDDVGKVFSDEKVDERFMHDLLNVEKCINTICKVALTSNQFSSLCSLVFNIGCTAFSRSTLLRELNKGNYISVPNEILRWNKAGGKVVNGLIARRKAEADLWKS